MALINCPECSAQVSNFAESCPKCAYPIVGRDSKQAHGGKIQTVEQTSKRYKSQQLLSLLLIIISVIVIIMAPSADDSNMISYGLLGLLIGLLWRISVRFSVWWHHG